MADPVHVRSIAALSELRTALVRFGEDADCALDAVRRESERTLLFLVQRLNYWRQQTRVWQDKANRAKRELEACEAARRHPFPPDCRGLDEVWLEALRRYRQAEANAREASDWLDLAQRAVADFQPHAGRLQGHLRNTLPQAVARLRQLEIRLRDLAAYQFAKPGITQTGIIFETAPSIDSSDDDIETSSFSHGAPELEGGEEGELSPETHEGARRLGLGETTDEPMLEWWHSREAW